MDRTQHEARKRAYASLGIADLEQERKEVVKQKEACDERETEIEREMLARIQGVPADRVDENTGPYYYDSFERRIERALEKREEVHRDELLAESETGRKILELQEEKANVLDAVWISSSPKEIRRLWDKVTAYLGEANSRLVQEALAIEPETSQPSASAEQ